MIETVKTKQGEKKMRTLRLIETGRKTKIANIEYETLQCAADRLVARDYSGHFAIFCGCPEPGNLFAEICSSAGDLCVHTGNKITFEILP